MYTIHSPVNTYCMHAHAQEKCYILVMVRHIIRQAILAIVLAFILICCAAVDLMLPENLSG